MDSRTLFLVFTLFYVGACLELPQKHYKKKLIMGRPRGGLVPKLKNVDRSNSGVSNDLFITSKVDHFDSSNSATFQQRYWYNDQWYKPGGPIFLYINGESAGDADWITSGSQLTTLAAQLGAMTFSVEHRYYGGYWGSQVNGNKDMKYLSSRQALADLADFIKAMNKKYNYQGAKWVSFGGSYAGALSAWSRMLYPDLIFGAVASSGPVQAVVDYVGYLGVVDQVLLTYNNTQANINCGQTVKDALAQVVQLMKTSSGRQTLFKKFQLCQPLDPNDSKLMGNFYSTILDPLMVDVQYGSYEDDCSYLTDPSTGSTALDRFYSYVTGNTADSCLDIDYNEYIQEIKSDSDDASWTYQTCTEFGFYQSTDSTNLGFYGNIIPVNWYVQQCAEVFGANLGNATVYKNIDNTNSFYHGQNGYNGTMVVLPNGLADPWHILGVLTAPNTQDHTVLIPGASHCADMSADDPSDSPAMKAAKKQIRGYVTSWFSQ